MENPTSGIETQTSVSSLGARIKKVARIAGRELVEKALTLYFALQDPSVPAWAKSICLGALGYFFFPLDAIPDFIGPVGYTDDLGAIAGALGAIAIHVSKETRDRARAKAAEWFAA